MVVTIRTGDYSRGLAHDMLWNVMTCGRNNKRHTSVSSAWPKGVPAMANKTLFRSMVGRLLPKTDTLNEEGRAGLRLLGRARLGPVCGYRLLELHVLCLGRGTTRPGIGTVRAGRAGVHRPDGALCPAEGIYEGLAGPVVSRCCRSVRPVCWPRSSIGSSTRQRCSATSCRSSVRAWSAARVSGRCRSG